MAKLTDEEYKIKEESILYVKKNKKELIKIFTGDFSKNKKTDYNIGIFMAGSPGAGKTEFASLLIDRPEYRENLIHIDPDRIRSWLPSHLYKGNNSHVVQMASTIGTEKIFDQVLKKRVNFILDTTFSDLEKCRENIGRIIKNGYSFMSIYFIYQDPIKAWEFTSARETIEGRRVDLDVFVEKYFSSREVVNALKKEFGKRLVVDLIFNNRDSKNPKKSVFNIASLEDHINDGYDRQTLKKYLSKVDL